MTGWGVYGLNLTLQLQLQLQFNFEVLSLVPTETSSLLDLLHKALLHPVFSNQHKFQEILATNPGKSINCNFPVLHSLGNNFVTKEVAKGSLNVGIIFFEDTHLTPQALDKAKNYDVIVAGSNWNAEVLKGYGLSDVRMVRQGIDPTIFHAAAKSNLLEASAIASPTDKIRRAWLTFQLHSQERSGAVRCS